jgi:hypothetical protein
MRCQSFTGRDYAVNRYSKIKNSGLETVQCRPFPFSSKESEVEVELSKRCYNIANVSLMLRSCMTGWQHRDGLDGDALILRAGNRM